MSSSSERIPVVPDVLAWARKSAGFPQDVAAKRLGVADASLEKWESGELLPTIKQLRKAAKLYKRPLAVLLLSSPPKDFEAVRDFRRRSDGNVAELSPELRGEVRRAQTQREVFLELKELAPATLPDSGPTLQLTTDTPAEEAGRSIRSLVGIDERRLGASPHDHLNVWASALEELGVLVIHTRGVAIAEMRGFSLSEWPYPVVALNGSDFPRPRLFTLVHEFAHLALNAGGLCDLHETRTKPSPGDQLEHYCNQVAATALMPADRLLEQAMVRSASPNTAWTLDELGDLARPFGTSSESLLLRLITLQLASWELYWNLKPQLEAEYEGARARIKEQQKEKEGGPSYYIVKARDLGHGYVASVLDAFQARAITSVDVADYLDVRFDQLPKLRAALR